MERNKGKIITVTSTKGGVGKTITTLNLAGVFSNLKKKVLVIDFDLYGGAVATYLNSKNDKTIFNLITDLSNNKYKNIVLIGGWTGMSKHKIQYKIELHIEAIITFNNSLMEA